MNRGFLFSFLLLVCLLSCRKGIDPESLEIYEGPVNSAQNIHILHSDSAVLRSEITAPKQLEFANGDLEFPEGIDIQFFNSVSFELILRQIYTTLVDFRSTNIHFIENEFSYALLKGTHCI